MKNTFLFGCNYWASNAGCQMWKNFDERVVEKDIALLAEYGVNCIRIFPNWEDFQPIMRIRQPEGNYYKLKPFKIRVDERPLRYEPFPDSGLSSEKVEQFRFVLEIAKKYKMKVIVAFLTGWMSGRIFVPEAVRDKNYLTDAETILWECRFIKDLIGEIKDYSNIVAWELGNECNCLSHDITEAQTELWISTISNAIRMADPSRPVYSGMHGTNVQGCWNLPMQGKYLDMVMVHPYPAYTPYCSTEGMRSMRASLHAAAENAYYSGIANRPCMIEEIGTLGQTHLANRFVPEYLEKSLLTSLSVGSTGYLWWCGFEQDNLNFAPYDIETAEQDLGLSYRNYKVKPILEKYKEIRPLLDQIGVLPKPQVDAVVLLPHGAMESPWCEAYGAFMLGVQSGRYVDFCYEEQALKDSEYYIVPLYGDISSVTEFVVRELMEKINNGANLLITTNGGFISHFEELTGLCVKEHETRKVVREFNVNGKECKIESDAYLKLEVDTARVLLRDNASKVLFTENRFGKGRVYFFNAPIEKAYTESYKPEDTALYEIYKIFFEKQKKIFMVNDPKCMVTIHNLSEETFAVTVNSYSKDKLPFALQKGYQIDKVINANVDKHILNTKNGFAYLEISKTI